MLEGVAGQKKGRVPGQFDSRVREVQDTDETLAAGEGEHPR
jgi:hypothetical protein